MKSKSGQALLEYILLLLISLTLILGVVWKFNSAFHDYAYQLFRPDEGGYLFCLIQNAVLPGDDSCQANLPTFNYGSAPQKQVAQITPSSPNDGAGLFGPPSSHSSTNNASQNNKSPTSSSSGGGTRQHATGVSASGSSGFAPNLERSGRGGSNGGAAGAEGKDKDKKGKGGSFEGGSGSDTASSSSDGFSGSRSRFVSAGKDGRTSLQGDQKVPTNERDLKTAREIASEKLKKKAAREDDSQFTFANFIKWIIIIALLLLIIFFVGSQLVAVGRGNKRQ